MIFAPVDRIDQVLRLALEDPQPDDGRESTSDSEAAPGLSSIETEPLVAKSRRP
jgi:hypothetical protein